MGSQFTARGCLESAFGSGRDMVGNCSLGVWGLGGKMTVGSYS